jgi:hypothetical protein
MNVVLASSSLIVFHHALVLLLDSQLFVLVCFAGICAVILPTAFCMLSKFCNLFYLQTRPVHYSQVVFIQAHKEGKSPVPDVFALLSKKVCLFSPDTEIL